MEDLISISDYAKQRGCSVQAVYKRLNTTLKPYVVEVDGKKMLRVAALEFDGSTVENPGVDKTLNGSTTVQQPEVGITKELLRLLEEQLTAKDAEIARLHGEVESARAAAAAAEEHNREQSKQLALLLAQSQELQRNNQLLLAAQVKQPEPEEDPDPVVVQPPQDPEEKPKKEEKKGFWKWFFGI